MPSIDTYAPRDEVRHASVTFKPGQDPLEVDYYINRITSEPVVLTQEQYDDEEDESGRAAMRNALSLCDWIKGWDLTGPLKNRAGAEVVAAGETVPMDPHVLRVLPLPLTRAIIDRLIAVVFPNRAGSPKSPKRS